LFDLREATGHSVPEALRKGILICSHLLHPDPSLSSAALRRLPAPLQHEDRGSLFELAWMLGCLEEASCGEALLAPRSLAAEKKCTILSRGGEMLLEWPHSLPALLTRTLDQDPSGIATMQVVKNLKKIRNKKYRFSRPIELAMAAGLTTPGRKHTKVALESIGYLTAQGFAERASIRLSEVRQLRLAGAVEYQLLDDGGRSRVVFPTQSVIAARQSMNSRLSARHVANHLKISIDGVFDLLEEGMLTPTTDAVVKCLWGKLHVDPVNARLLIASIDQAVSRDTPPSDFVRLGFGPQEVPGPLSPAGDYPGAAFCKSEAVCSSPFQAGPECLPCAG
jgi:hypothetical protein